MGYELLQALSNADSIASHEGEVRNLMVKELKDYVHEVSTDNLGSVIFKKVGNPDGVKVMLCAHLDEVGFAVRSLTKDGMIMLMEVGGVKPLAEITQSVRVTTRGGRKIKGIINGTYQDGVINKLYMDIGATSQEELVDLGIEIGDMVTFTTEYEEFDLEGIVCGKAFDDRLGCYVISEIIKRLEGKAHPNIVYGVGTSSEEVGIRGAKTATYKINPDVVLPIDVACFSDELIRNHENKRQIGKGMMLTNFDRTLVPNKKVIEWIKNTAKNRGKNIQLDMFTRGGTDGGEAHIAFEGKPVAVACLPVRYGHCGYSIAHKRDIEDMIDIYVQLLLELDNNKYKQFVDFLGGE